MYEQQNQELDRDKRIELVHQMLTLFHNESTYVVLYHDADTQAYRTDRFEGWVQQPKGTGPVLFSNTSPSYWSLAPIGEGSGTTDSTAPGSTDGSGTGHPGDNDGGGDDGSNTGLIIAIVAGVLVLVVGGMVLGRSRRSRDDRE